MSKSELAQLKVSLPAMGWRHDRQRGGATTQRGAHVHNAWVFFEDHPSEWGQWRCRILGHGCSLVVNDKTLQGLASLIRVLLRAQDRSIFQ